MKTTPEKPAKPPKKTLRLGEYLVMIGLIDKETLNKALKTQKSSKKKLGEVLVDMGVADDVVIAKALAIRLKLPYGRIDKADIPNDIIALISPELAKKHAVIPLRMNGNRLLVAMSNPLDLYALEDLRFYTQLPIDRAVVTSSDIAANIEKYYPQPNLEMNLGLEFGAGDDDIEVVERKKERKRDTHKRASGSWRPPPHCQICQFRYR